LLVDLNLAIGARTTWVVSESAQVAHFVTAAQVVNNILDKVQGFIDGVVTLTLSHPPVII
jgi:hypothetical protein